MNHKKQFGLVLLLFIGCASPIFQNKWVDQKAPNIFYARFETTHGSFEIEAIREWSPAAVDRLYQLIKHGFYSDIAIFRVVPDYVVQFGISDDSVANNAWRQFKIPDEQVIQKNEYGTIAFARGGPESRSTQLFININNNSPRLDTLTYNGVSGFPVIARVTKGMENVVQFFDDYGNEPSKMQDSIQIQGNKFLYKNFPELDYIESSYLIDMMN